MQHEVGSIVDGKVTGITKFGAFVELEGGTVGMVHISEVSQTYVNDISEHLKDQQQVKVKILSIGDDGKISLSIKKALPPTPFVRRDNKPNNFNNNNNNNRAQGGTPRPAGNNFNRPASGNVGGRPQNGNFNRAQQAPKGPATFEDMLSKFMSSSEDKFADVKKPSSNRRGGYNKKGPKDYD